MSARYLRKGLSGCVLVLACLLASLASALEALPLDQPLPMEFLWQTSPLQPLRGESSEQFAHRLAGEAGSRLERGQRLSVEPQSIWFVLRLNNPESAFLRLLVELPLANLPMLEWFVFANGELQYSQTLDYNQPFSARAFPYSRVLLPLPLAPATETVAVLHVDTYAHLITQGSALWREEARFAAMLPEIGAIWFFIGAMCVMLCYHLIIALITRESSYGFYSLWLAVSLLVTLAHHGYGFWYLWPDWPWWEARATLVLSLLLMVSFAWFSRAFLHLPKRLPLLSRLLDVGTALLLVLIVVFLVESQNSLFWVVRIGLGIMACLAMAIWLSSLRLWISGHREARNFFIAWTPFLFYVLGVVLHRVWTQRLYDPAHVSQSWVFALTVILLSIALADRLRDLRDRSRQARVESRAKSEFLAKMSHEIRTPLNGMLGMASLLRETRLDKMQRHYSDVIYSSGTTLLTVINDILDYSKIEAGKMRLERIPFDLEKLALEALSVFKAQADEKGLDLVFDADQRLPGLLLGDPNRCRQIIINLLSNAIKFTERGEVVLRLVWQPGRIETVRLEVEDTGIGISKENREHLFDFFTQADSSTSRKYGGTGLGLAICRELVTLMGGQVGVESEEFQGSLFWVSLALPAVPNAQLATLPSSPLRGKRLLAVDDCQTFLSLLQRYAQHWQAELVLASNAAEAERRVQEALAADRPFDLISIDLRMPGMNGLELAAQWQANPALAATPRLLLTSAIDLPSRGELHRRGLLAAVEKPVTPAALEQIFAQALNGTLDQDNAPQLMGLGATVPVRACNILVAEDNEVNQMVIRGLLERLGHEVTVVRNGALVVEAYTTCRQPDSHWKPFDLILMDCEMPEVDGYEATHRIRAWEAAQNDGQAVRIIALTAHVLPDYLERCLSSGMDDYLLKPVSAQALQEKIIGTKAASPDRH